MHGSSPKKRFDVVFLGLARNCAEYIPNFIQLISDLEKEGLSVGVIAGEDGSSDSTRSLLSAEPNIVVLDTSFMAAIPRRLERMARGRQFLADASRSVESRYVAVVDLDNPMASPPTHASVLNALKRLDAGPYFAISAQSKPYYYDILAFEEAGRDFGGAKMRSTQRKKGHLAAYRFYRDNVYRNQKAISVDEPITCTSAFNGLCIYSREAFDLGSYVDQADYTFCEHIYFNRSIAKHSGKLMQIDPDMVVAMPEEHGPRSLPSFMTRIVRSKVKSVLGV